MSTGDWPGLSISSPEAESQGRVLSKFPSESHLHLDFCTQPNVNQKEEEVKHLSRLERSKEDDRQKQDSDQKRKGYTKIVSRGRLWDSEICS